MSLQVRYCPQCGTRRTGYFRFCGRCGLDFDELALVKPGEGDAPTTDAKAEPTTPIWPPPPPVWPPPDAMPSAAVQAIQERVAAVAAERASAAVAGPTAAVTRERIAPPPAAPMPAAPAEPEAILASAVAWPTPEARPASRQLPEDRPILARTLALPSATAGADVRPVPRGTVIPSRPGVTWTRIAIVALAGLLAFSAVSRALGPSATGERTPLPTTAVATPLIVTSGEPSAAPSAATPGPDASFGPTGETQVATVTRIVDGDTIHVDMNGTDYSVRYIGIDTPEPDATDPIVKQLADKATVQNAALVEGQEVYLEKDVSETDQYGRLLRDIWLVDSGGSMVLINLELVRLGYAQVTTFPPDVKYVDQLSAAQSKAKADGVGLWATGAPTPTAKPAAKATPKTLVSAGSGASCHPNYAPCLPIVADLDCPDVRAMGKAPVRVKGSDPYRLDRDHDGLGCE